jgi:hypothetical protein
MNLIFRSALAGRNGDLREHRVQQLGSALLVSVGYVRTIVQVRAKSSVTVEISKDGRVTRVM